MAIIEGAERGQWTLLSSSALEFELARTKDPQRRSRTRRFLSAARERIAVRAEEVIRAENLCKSHGLTELDALHLACAETLRADVFLTTDDRLLHACRRMAHGEVPFVVANPLAWLTHFPEHG